MCTSEETTRSHDGHSFALHHYADTQSRRSLLGGRTPIEEYVRLMDKRIIFDTFSHRTTRLFTQPTALGPNLTLIALRNCSNDLRSGRVLITDPAE